MSGQLDALLRPRSVAVIGASADPTKRGHHAVRALLESGYDGRIVPVNPGGGELLGLPVVRSPAELDQAPDLALVCTPAATIPGVVEEWARAGSRGAVVLASGFAESGENGAALEAALSDVIERTGIRVIGPNTSGILNVPLGLNLIGLREVRAGGLALLVQSGNIALQLVTEAASRTDAGFSFCVGVGNEVDVRFHELLEFLASDETTRAILMHVEGFRDGHAFLETARRVGRAKPIVLLKGGRTEAGGVAARSHTGAIVGSYATLRAALRQAGVVEVLRTDELLHVAETLASQPTPRAGAGIVILSDGGGHATIAADTLHDRGFVLPPLAAATAQSLRGLLGPAAAVGNPIDLAGAADRDPLVFARALELAARDPAVATVLVVGLFGGYAIRFAAALQGPEVDAASEMARIACAAGVGLVVHSLYAPTRSAPLRALTAAGVPVITSLDVACRVVAALHERAAMLDRGTVSQQRGEQATGRAPRVAQPLAGTDGLLLEPDARALVASFDVPLVPASFCANAAEAAAAAAVFDVPVAVRAVSPATPHRTEAGGVLLGVDAAGAANAFDRVAAAVQRFAEARGVAADFRGVMVSPMLPPPIAELLIGVIRDPQFGPVLTIGAGGTAVEVLRDVAIRVLPVGYEEIFEMIDELHIAPILRGLRGGAGADLHAIARAASALAACLLAHDALTEAEINPLFAYKEGVRAIDVRIVSAL